MLMVNRLHVGLKLNTWYSSLCRQWDFWYISDQFVYCFS